jgi:hypothetical protein
VNPKQTGGTNGQFLQEPHQHAYRKTVLQSQQIHRCHENLRNPSRACHIVAGCGPGTHGLGATPVRATAVRATRPLFAATDQAGGQTP